MEFGRTKTGKRDDARLAQRLLKRHLSARDTFDSEQRLRARWMELQGQVAQCPRLCSLKGKMSQDPFIRIVESNEPYKNKNPKLDQSVIPFEWNAYACGEFKPLHRGSETLIIPPYDIGACDIQDFARRYSQTEWAELYAAIRRHWEGGAVFSTRPKTHYLTVRIRLPGQSTQA